MHGGVEVLPDATILTTTYGHWQKGEAPYILSVRLTASELDACYSRNGTQDVANSFEQRLSYQHVAFGQEHGWLTVDEEVALFSRAQYEVAATETAFTEKLEQSIHRGVPPRPGRSCNRGLSRLG